jgi:hypothetical protein
MAEDGRIIRGEQQDAEKRSIGSAVGQFLTDAEHGAGWTAGALGVAGTVKVITGALSGHKPKEPPKKS